jgi:sarcosine oxidase
MAAWQLASRGHRVVAVDRFPVPGPFSAYSGESRVFRMIYMEGGHYTPLLQRAQSLWRQLETVSGTELLHITGAVTLTHKDHPEHAAMLTAGRDRGLTFDVLTGADAAQRLPLHTLRDDDVALFDPEGGFVRSERAVCAAIREAELAGATFLGQRTVLDLDKVGNNWRVQTDQEAIVAPRVIVATGTGAGRLCSTLGTRLAIRPQVLTWFPIKNPTEYARHPQEVFIRRADPVKFYGFPSSDGWTVKVAASIYLDNVDSFDRPISWDPAHLDTISSWVADLLPALEPQPVRVAVCADGYTPDDTALLGAVPGMDGVVVAVGFSGHGFKMAPALGAVAADLAVDGKTDTDVTFMNPGRFLPSGSTVSSLPVATKPAAAALQGM